MSALVQDLRSGLRNIRTHLGFTAVVVIILALGIGANTTIFGVIHALLFFPMPFKDAEQLVYVTETSERSRGGGTTSYPAFLDWKGQNQVFEDMAGFASEAVNLAGGSEPERLSSLRVSGSALSLLGAQPVWGRAFLASEFTAEGSRAVLLSHSLWQRRFGADRAIIGQILKVNGQAHTVVGILPENLKMALALGFEPALWMPLVPAPYEDRSARTCLVLARRKPGITMERARADMEVIARRITASHPDTNKGWTASVSPLRPEVDTVAYVVLAILVGSILALVCANVTNLLLARAVAREREFAVRAALGASRMRLVCQLLTENLMLLLLGCALGVLAAVWACDWISARFIDTNLGLLRIRIDAPVLAATAVLFLLAGTIVGLVPALQISGAGLSQPLKEGSRSLSGGVSKRRFKNFLVASEVAFSLLLLMGASLAVKSWFQLWSVDLGFRPEKVLAMRISLADRQYPDSDRKIAFFQQLLGRLESRPEVRSAGVASDLPTASPERSFIIGGRPLPAVGEAPQARFTAVSAGYFNTLAIAVKTGRQFTEQDVTTSPAVAIVNESMVGRYWTDQNPIGGRIDVAGRLRTVVGVVADVRSIPLSRKPVPEIFVPFTQAPGGDMAVVAATALADPLAITAAVKQEVRAIDPDQPISRIMTMESVCSSNMGVIRFGTSALSLVAFGALILAAVGLYGVLSYAVSQRTHEIGVRVALGAGPRDILGLVLGQGLTLTLFGIVPGLTASLVLGRVLSSSLFGVRPVEFLILAGISLLFILVSATACYLPARRAASVDPMQALRNP
jgi:putative ABC transport system permease protein